MNDQPTGFQFCRLRTLGSIHLTDSLAALITTP
jgi:hypothetical protein